MTSSKFRFFAARVAYSCHHVCWRWRRTHMRMCDCRKCRRRRNCCSTIFRQLKFAFAPGQAGGRAGRQAGTLSLERASVSNHRGELGELIALLLLQSPSSSSSFAARLWRLNSFLASRGRGCVNSRVRRSLNSERNFAASGKKVGAPAPARARASLHSLLRRPTVC